MISLKFLKFLFNWKTIQKRFMERAKSDPRYFETLNQFIDSINFKVSAYSKHFNVLNFYFRETS